MTAGSDYELELSDLSGTPRGNAEQAIQRLLHDIGKRLVALEEGLERLETKLANLQEVNNLWDGS